MALKVIIVIAVIVILVFLFKGMGGQQMAQQPSTTPPTTTTAPTAQGTAPAAGQHGVSTTPAIPATPAEKAAATTKMAGVNLMSDVKCDYATNKVSFTLTNVVEKQPLQVYQGELNVLAPQTPDTNVVKFAINNRRYPQARINWTIDCGATKEILPKATAACTISNVVLRDPNQVDKMTGMKAQNVLSATNVNNAYKSTNQIVQFTC